ncbi:MAG: ABC transporter ATP-binding protein [Pseudomonadales bacterium]
MNTSNQPPIDFRDVSVVYERKSLWGTKITPILNNITLQLHQGETLGVIGRNGAGKSTLLKLIAQVLRPSSGTVTLAEGARATLLSYQLGFTPHMTGEENAVYSGMLFGMQRAQVESCMDEIFTFAGLEKQRKDLVSTYSAGMKARLGFSVALWADPDIILIDEALGVGDHEFRLRSSEAIRTWIKTDKTVVFVSHDEHSVRALCDKVLWLENGEAVYQGATDEAIDLYLAYDHLVHSIALKHPEWTEDTIRSHPRNKNPVQVLKTMRRELKDQWKGHRKQVQDRFQGVVKIHDPVITIIPYVIVEDDCGQFLWIEKTKIIHQGSKEQVLALRAEFDTIVGQFAARSNSTLEDFTKSELYSRLLTMVKNSGSLPCEPEQSEAL